MIKAQEFRIGNYVEFDSRIFQIDTIAKVFPTLNTDEFGIGVVDWNNISPIPLTEEWLLKFGLLKNDIGIWNNGDAIYFNYGFEKSIKLNNVHQLQNLFNCLNSEELTIKEDNNEQ